MQDKIIRKLLEVIGELTDEVAALRAENEILTKKLKSTEDVAPTPPATPDWGKPYGPFTYPNQPNYEPVTLGASCVKCGLKLEGVMSYVCSQEKCPTGLGGSWCTTNSSL